MDIAQRLFADRGIALVDTVGGRPVAKEMLGRGDDLAAGDQALGRRRALQPAQSRADIARHQRRVRRIALVGAAPAVILRHGHGGRKRPVKPGHADLGGGGRTDPFDQRRIVRRAKPDVVRKQRGADDVRMAVHSIGAPDHRNADAAIALVDRGMPIGIGQLQPGGGRSLVIATGPAVAAIEHRAEVIAVHIFRRGAADIALHHLADLFLQRHPRDQGGNAPFGRRIGQGGIGVHRPDRGMRGAGRIGGERRHRQGKQGGRQQAADHALRLSDRCGNSAAWGMAPAPPAMVSRLMRVSRPRKVAGSIAAISGSDRRGARPIPSNT